LSTRIWTPHFSHLETQWVHRKIFLTASSFLFRMMASFFFPGAFKFFIKADDVSHDLSTVTA
jgi:hypothetical protein